MSKRRLVITAVLAGQSQSEVARTYGVSQGWISKLMARYRTEGEAAFEPRSRAPKTSPAATPPATVELVLQLRKQLSDAGHDADTETDQGSDASDDAGSLTLTLRVTNTLDAGPGSLRQALLDAASASSTSSGAPATMPPKTAEAAMSDPVLSATTSR